MSDSKIISTVGQGYMLKHKAKGYYAAHQPQYDYSWTHDLAKAKIFKNVGGDYLRHYLGYTNQNEGSDACKIVTCSIQSTIIVDDSYIDDLDDKFIIEYKELLGVVNSYDDVEKVPEKIWKKFKGARIMMVDMGKLAESAYIHRSDKNDPDKQSKDGV